MKINKIRPIIPIKGYEDTSSVSNFNDEINSFRTTWKPNPA